jgi:sortase A
MKLSVEKASVWRILRWTQRLLFVCAVALLGYCAFVWVDASIFQKRANLELERRLRDAPRPVSRPGPPEASRAIGPHGLIGRIEIARIGLSAVVFEGTGKDTLRRAAGHISSTPLPGEPGNSGIAGHRDSFFRPLKDIRRNDLIQFTTPRGAYRYRVVSIRVVAPTEVSVLNPSENEVLTLVTCYPFYFVGAAPSRFIVRAERVGDSA